MTLSLSGYIALVIYLFTVALALTSIAKGIDTDVENKKLRKENRDLKVQRNHEIVIKTVLSFDFITKK